MSANKHSQATLPKKEPATDDFPPQDVMLDEILSAMHTDMEQKQRDNTPAPPEHANTMPDPFLNVAGGINGNYTPKWLSRLQLSQNKQKSK